MLLTLTTTHRPATDLGYLLHKHPARLHSRQLAFGTAHVFYPEATDERCTAALYVEVDPIGLVRKKRGGDFALRHYVNDRPYVASSLLSVAIARTLGSALGGRTDERPELAAAPLPLRAEIAALPCRTGWRSEDRADREAEMIHRLFEPLGYAVSTHRIELDPRFPDWGPSPYFTVAIEGTVRLADLLAHLYVLIPVLDDDKHYWVGDTEIEKLLARGREWLPEHPEKELITRRYLRHQRRLARSALARLTADEELDPEDTQRRRADEELELERPLRLHELRLAAVRDLLKEAGARRVLDLGCGEGRLLELLLDDPWFVEVAGLDVSLQALDAARRRLDQRPLGGRGGEPHLGGRRRLRFLHGALTYRDRRLEGFDGAALVEVVEHLDPSRLDAFERAVFAAARPRTVVLTTPNAEYNARFETLPTGRFRHRDHRFEWTREEFEAWAGEVAAGNGYRVRFHALGPEDPSLGAPTQAGVFTR